MDFDKLAFSSWRRWRQEPETVRQQKSDVQQQRRHYGQPRDACCDRLLYLLRLGSHGAELIREALPIDRVLE
ncbi:MAG: hypothetical protein M3347_13925 [Armatimonadota bacterium]|nr:hypothetical protein [Armatimonadota bacterium]